MRFALRGFFEELGRIDGSNVGHETDAAVLCLVRAQVVAPHELLGVPELPELQSAGTSPEAAASLSHSCC
jgi:hypothetical protein